MPTEFRLSHLVRESKSILTAIHAGPRKKLGQNFMIQEEALGEIAGALCLNEDESVLEIGPGLGFLTRFLLNKKARVMAIEKDVLYAKFLREYFKDKDFHLITGDVLDLNLKKDFGVSSPIKVVGNIPYNITSPLLAWLIAERSLISEAVITLQKEVAERLCASCGTKSWGVLSIFVQLYCDVKFIKKITRDKFYPSPGVDSAVVQLTFLKTPRPLLKNEDIFFKLVRRAFQKRRKMLLNALASKDPGPFLKTTLDQTFRQLGLDPARRPETLSLGEWAALANTLCSQSL